MRILSRGNLQNLWLHTKEGELLEGDEAIRARMVQEHGRATVLVDYDLWNPV